MTVEEAEKILKGDVSGLEFMTEEVYKVCKKLVAITDFECCFYGTTEEVKWAEAFITSYEHYKKEGWIK